MSQCPFSSNPPDEWHNAELNFSDSMSYGDYLDLGRILSAQHPLSPDHNEMLFIIQHQTSELWMKLMLHELKAAREQVRQGQLPPAFKMLARVSRIFDQLVHAWAVLATMTPSEYKSIRPYLGQSSGFQSFQYREIEFILGNKSAALLRPHAHRPELLQSLEESIATPSMYDEAIALMARSGLSIDPARLALQSTTTTQHDPSVEVAWREVYANPSAYWDLYQLAEKFIDLEDSFRQWRFRHVTTVERIIGFQPGTGGTEGVGYLRKMLDTVLFPELWRVRSSL
ncbi:tryptophan 2,3-dioxygenase [Pseudomonas sp. TKO26]|uniref:tryptophan 2,3-dioxygenase n=1 Tax=unclassified Pseudomonas TaxID=196821 RepID=UPI000D860D04|nr:MULTISPECIES: tryptophan 2,3-dioxygenase [unclassified Pseudomonas]PYY90381.1 tryptophan 2,3-dioxygenase [Pseudomonas sp. TKO30]PYY93253.1 tryptophan 2,3-dioxygenase [Pseudomonas sp. TKO29]PYY95481.1 tryptophan 2,3-dioxygenase [Pseudomonas sp. TKO26]PYZ01413.1 tryptophan 2,3-dioxygenase [Pseudomonas sp. TKO14]